MTKLPLKFVHAFVDRHGKTRHYFRREGRRIALPGAPFSEEFIAAYQKALASNGAPIRLTVGAKRTKAGSINALAVAWYESADFKNLSAATQTTYRGVVERIRADHGDKPVDGLEPSHIRKLMAARASTPGAANFLLRMIRLLMRFAVEEEWRSDNPAIGIRKLKIRSEGFHTWTEEEIAQFEKHHPLGSRARLAFALLLYTGQRKSDVIRMGRQHLRGSTIEVRQSKTRTALALAVHPDLKAAIDAFPSNHLNFLTTHLGEPFTAAGFGNWFRDCCNEAGLPKRCSSHGLRKAMARRLAEAGRSANSIASVTGHKTLGEVARYTKAADQEKLARKAINSIRRTKSD